MFRALWCVALICAAVVGLSASAHPGFPGSAIVHVDAAGKFTIHVRLDALAFALNETPVDIADEPMRQLLAGPREQLDKALEEGRQRFAQLFEVTANGQGVALQLTGSPTRAQIEEAESRSNPVRLPIMLEFAGEAQLLDGTNRFAVKFPQVMGNVIVTFERPGKEPMSLPLAAGERSPELPLTLTITGDVEESGEAAPSEISTLRVIWQFIEHGFVHIIPAGLDHCLFVLGLFLLSPRIKPVLWQISSFTVAHTITLTLTSLDIVGMPASIVEPAIAASVAFIGIENLTTTKVSHWRILVAFCFGLLHGMGIATAFHEAGFPPGHLVPSLAAFTVGVEAGHLAVLAMAFVILAWTKDKPWYRRGVAIPLSLAIAAIAVYWFIERVFAG
jgi:hydrogenase/urease accessory protein HupE